MTAWVDTIRVTGTISPPPPPFQWTTRGPFVGMACRNLTAYTPYPFLDDTLGSGHFPLIHSNLIQPLQHRV